MVKRYGLLIEKIDFIVNDFSTKLALLYYAIKNAIVHKVFEDNYVI